MAEFTAVANQVVAANQNVALTETPVCGGMNIIHREGAGIVVLRGTCSQCRARYKVSFGANISVPTGGTVGAISIALSVQGEPLQSTVATVTPAAVEELFNVYTAVFVDVPKGCCVTVAVRNVSDQAINVVNSNLIIERVA